jgi:hypothetical protein
LFVVLNPVNIRRDITSFCKGSLALNAILLTAMFYPFNDGLGHRHPLVVTSCHNFAYQIQQFQVASKTLFMSLFSQNPEDMTKGT